jgi:hypothetical protein
MRKHRELRNFGLSLGLAIALIAGLGLPVLWKLPLSPWPWIVGALLMLAGWLTPRLLGPFFRLWMRFAELLGAINSRIILTICFYLIILPFGLFLRMFRGDPMARRFAKKAGSYRVHSKQPSSMERPF